MKTTRNAVKRTENSEIHGMEDEQSCRFEQDVSWQLRESEINSYPTDPGILMVGLLAQLEEGLVGPDDAAELQLWKCVGHQVDNAPDCGVAQGVIHGVSVRDGEKQEEEEGEIEQEVERNKEEEKSNTSAHVHG